MKALGLICKALVILPAFSQFSCNSGEDKNQTKTHTAEMVSGNYATVNDLRLYYEVRGEGDPLVLLHGGGSTINTSFGRIIPLLARNRQVIAVELQAHGHSGDRNTPITFEQDADDVVALLDRLHLKKADFMGFSNGGTTVLQIAMRHPRVVNKIIVASAMSKRSGAPPQFWEFMKKGTIEEMPPALVQAYKEVAADPSQLNVMFEKCASRMIHFVDIPDEKVRMIKAPALVVSGDRDVNTTDHALELHKMIANSRLCILPGGHGTYMGEITTLKTGQEEFRGFVCLLEEFLGEPFP